MENFLENYKSSTPDYTNILGQLLNFKEQVKIEVICLQFMEAEIKEICQNNFEQFSNMNYEDVDYQLRIQKELMKLAFDLWKDFSYFSLFSFKSKYNSRSYEKGLVKLQYKCDHGQWGSPTRVKNEQLLENIHKYIICYSVWEQKRRMLSSQFCSFCDAYLNYSSCCLYCESTIKDMGSIPIVENFNDELEDLADIEDYWNCKTCKEPNDFKIVICPTCENPGPHFGKWLCDRCHYINGPSDFVCSVCYDTNIYLKPCVSCQLIQVNSKFDIICCCCKAKCIGNWICEEPENHRIYGTLSMKCLKCMISPIDPPEKNKTISSIGTTGFTVEMWSCTFCKEFIEMDKDHCDYCLNLRYCDDRILCFYCGFVNESHHKYCLKCRKNLFEKNEILRQHTKKSCCVS